MSVKRIPGLDSGPQAERRGPMSSEAQDGGLMKTQGWGSLLRPRPVHLHMRKEPIHEGD